MLRFARLQSGWREVYDAVVVYLNARTHGLWII